jgi:probable DNA metabolism protein
LGVVYITDRSLDGLLTAVFTAYYTRDAVEGIEQGPPAQYDFTVRYREIETCEDQAVRVMAAIEQKIGDLAMHSVTRAWLSELPGSGMQILEFLRLGFAWGPSVMDRPTHPHVAAVLQAARKVSREQYRMLGLLRFRRLRSGPYLALMAPDHHQLPLIAPHFAGRMGASPWIIHDERRRQSALGEGGNWCIVPGKLPGEPRWDDEETVFQNLWRQYHRIIAIDSRINPLLQRAMMPRRYWKYLIEQPDALYRTPGALKSIPP